METARKKNSRCCNCASTEVEKETLLGMAFCSECWTALAHTDEFAELCEAELELRNSASWADPTMFTGSLSRTPRTPPANISG